MWFSLVVAQTRLVLISILNLLSFRDFRFFDGLKREPKPEDQLLNLCLDSPLYLESTGTFALFLFSQQTLGLQNILEKKSLKKRFRLSSITNTLWFGAGIDKLYPDRQYISSSQ